MKRLIIFITILLLAPATIYGKDKAGDASAVATISLSNESNYAMIYRVWREGETCSDTLIFDESVATHLTKQALSINLPAEQFIAIGVGIMEMQEKSPVDCEYILSFIPSAQQEYVLEYNVNDRHCYGNLFRKNGEVFDLVEPADNEELIERLPEFGWDQFEPGCY